MQKYDEDELLTRATRNYFRRFGAGANIPSNSSSVDEVDGKVFVRLENINGHLATYCMDTNGRLRFVETHA